MKKICTFLAATTLIGAMMPVVAQASQPTQEEIIINEDFINKSDLTLPSYANDNLEISPEEHDRLIEKMEQFLSVDDGQFVFEEIPQSIYNEFGYKLVEGLVQGIDVVNDLAEKDVVEINDDFSIIDTDEESTPIMASRTNRNVNRRTNHWWGIRHYLNRSRTATWANEFGRASNNANLSAGVIGLLTKGIGSAPFIVIGWNFGAMERSLQGRLNQTTNRGTIMNAHFTGTWSTAVQ